MFSAHVSVVNQSSEALSLSLSKSRDFSDSYIADLTDALKFDENQESVEVSLLLNERSSSAEEQVPGVPDMWSFYYIGLYSQYAAVGLLYGIVMLTLEFSLMTKLLCIII